MKNVKMLLRLIRNKTKEALDKTELILLVANSIFFCLCVIGMVFLSNSIIIGYENCLGILMLMLALQVSVNLSLFRPSPFINILNIVFLIFFAMPPIATLLLFNNAGADGLFSTSSSDEISSDPGLLYIFLGVHQNKALLIASIYLALAFLSLSSGLAVFNKFLRLEIDFRTHVDPRLLTNIFMFSFVIVAFSSAYYIYGIIVDINLIFGGISNSTLAILQAIFDQWRVLMVVTPTLLIFWRELSFVDRSLGILAVLCIASVSTLLGSKAGFMQVILYFILAFLITHSLGQTVKILRLYIFLFVGGLISFLAFGLGRFFRKVNIDPEAVGDLTINYAIGLYSFVERLNYTKLFYEFFNHAKYSEAVSFKYIFQSFVDKMTPGFDVFNISFASRRLYTILNPDATPGVMGNSMQMTFFAEMWLLMGWWSLLALFFAPLFFCCLVYVGKRTFQNSTIIQILIYSYILSLFYYWVEGMGTDMLLVLHGVYSLIFLTVLLSFAFLSSKLSARWKN